MKRLFALALLALLVLSARAWAEHAAIDLRIIRLDPDTGASAEETTATADREPPAGGLNARPLAKVRAGEPLVLQFVLTSTYPHGVKKDVTVRYYVVREKEPRQKALPALEDAVTRGQCRLNLKPKARVGARVRFTIKDPGIYLLRVDTLNTDSDHEHFSAIDLEAR